MLAWLLAAFVLTAGNAALGQTLSEQQPAPGIAEQDVTYPTVAAQPLPVKKPDDEGAPSYSLQVSAPPEKKSPPPSKKDSIKQPKDTTQEFWEHVPPPRKLDRVGFFLIAPDKPGYYSLLSLLLDEPSPTLPRMPYPPTAGDGYSFYDANYRYLENPRFGEVDLFSPLKRIHPTDDWLLSFGGEERVRFMDENGGYERITGIVNPDEWYRSRVYTDLWYRDLIRCYVEMMDDRVFNDKLTPLASDYDQADFLNLFVDAKLFSVARQPAYLRVGRQELYFGSQRLVSPSDWSNVRRTFQGVRGSWLGRDWTVDVFWVQPVLIEPNKLDPPDNNQNFTGLWSVYRPRKGQSVEFYYLDLDNRNPGVAVGRDGVAGFFNISTFGSRYSGDYHGLLWDFEGMYQLGTWSNQLDSAGAVTTGIGYQFANLPMNPQFWLYNDWASGSQNPSTGNIHGTFDQLFAWGHLYFGYLDLVGRQNIDDINAQFAFYPTKWIVTTVQNHVFHLDSARDALYNAAGTAIRSSPTGTAGTYVGDEIDFTTNFHLDLHNDIFLGYSKLFAGEFIHRTPGPQTGPALFYVQYSFKW
ncbi:MAG TPA: alginate export family protein [Gemmataceae bacterium]|nr:alginate export family protein [Gemmataceae bacterium]